RACRRRWAAPSSGPMSAASSTPAAGPAGAPASAARSSGRRVAVAAGLLAVAVVAVATWAAQQREDPAIVAAAEEAVATRTLDAAATAGALGPGDARGAGGRLVDAYAYATDTDEPLHVRVAGTFAPTLTI